MAAEEGKVDWMRGTKKADLSDIEVEKIRKAHEERGITVEVDADHPSQTSVTKTVVEGMPAPTEQVKK